MASLVNLLPEEVAGTKTIIKTARALNVSATVGILFFLVLGSLGVFVIYLKSGELNDLRVQNEELRTTVRSLEATETRLVLVKDRVEKVRMILDKRINEKSFRTQKELADNLPEGVTFSETEIDSDKSSFGVISNGSLALRSFFDQILAKEYTSLVLESINFNTFLGYQVLFNLD